MDSKSSKTIVLVRPAYSNIIYDKVYEPENDSDIDREIRPPLGLMALAGYLEIRGHNVRIVDGEPQLWDAEKTVQEVINCNPDIVGLTSTTPEYPFAFQIIKALREKSPDLEIILGGAHVTNLPEHTADDLGELVDWCVLYEGEKPLLAIAEGRAKEFVWDLNKSSKILMDHQRLSSDELSEFLPSRTALDMSAYKYTDSESGLVSNDALEAARGCPFKCTFCTSRMTSVSHRSADSIVLEIEESARDYGTRMFMFFDDTFTLSKTRATELFSRIVWGKKKGKIPSGVRFYGFTRANAIYDMDFLLLLKSAGCDKITFGIETGSDRLLKNVEKGTVKDDYRRVYQMLDEASILKRGSFILGFPYEDESTIWESIKFALELDLDEIGVNILTPYPGQQTLRQAFEGDGLWLRDDFHYEEFQNNKSEINWHHYWSMYKRWGVSVIETETLSGEALQYFHGVFLQEVYGSVQMARRRKAQIAKGNDDAYWHRPWHINSKRKSEREQQEKMTGRPTFAPTMHSRYTYNPIRVSDYQKRELLFGGKGKKNFIPKKFSKTFSQDRLAV
jgi:anaerobic magnesium-protoporphyrin IX monomethyl ester cyclase